MVRLHSCFTSKTMLTLLHAHVWLYWLMSDLWSNWPKIHFPPLLMELLLKCFFIAQKNSRNLIIFTVQGIPSFYCIFETVGWFPVVHFGLAHSAHSTHYVDIQLTFPLSCLIPDRVYLQVIVTMKTKCIHHMSFSPPSLSLSLLLSLSWASLQSQGSAPTTTLAVLWGEPTWVVPRQLRSTCNCLST